MSEAGAAKREVFIDSHIVFYPLSADANKVDRPEALMRNRPTIGVRVLNEAANVCVRKLGMKWDEPDAVYRGCPSRADRRKQPDAENPYM